MQTTQPHDRLIKKLLSNPGITRDILNLYLPKSAIQLMDLTHLTLQRDSFIDDEHRAFAVDLLFKTRIQNEDGYVWLLLEHQSTDDPWLPVRIFKYMALIWDHLRKTSKTPKVPLIYPLIIYNGQRPYSSTLTLSEMIQPASARALFDNLFKTPFPLIDLTTIEDDVLRQQAQDYVKGVSLLMTLKHVRDKALQLYFEQVLVKIFKQLDESGNRDEVVDMLYYLFKTNGYLDDREFLVILHNEFSEEVENNMMTLEERAIQRGREKGLQEGLQRGLQQGSQQVLEETARRLFTEGCDLSFISKITAL